MKSESESVPATPDFSGLISLCSSTLSQTRNRNVTRGGIESRLYWPRPRNGSILVSDSKRLFMGFSEKPGVIEYTMPSPKMLPFPFLVSYPGIGLAVMSSALVDIL